MLWQPTFIFLLFNKSSIVLMLSEDDCRSATIFAEYETYKNIKAVKTNNVNVLPGTPDGTTSHP